MPPLVPKTCTCFSRGHNPAVGRWRGAGSVVNLFTEEEAQTGSGPAPSHGQ